MTAFRRLRVRLFLSYLAVILTGAITLTVALSLLAPSAFDRTMHGYGMGMGARNGQNTHTAFVDALRTSLPIAIGVSIVVAAAVAAFVGRRIIDPLDAVRAAAARLREGHYDERIPEPVEVELAALARDINALASSLESTERRRSELIGEVAHEMRTPLTVIEGYVEGILDGVFEPSEEVLTAVSEETTRLRRLSTDLATLSRTDENMLDISIQREDLCALTRAVAARLQPQFDGKSVQLIADAACRVPVDCDAARIGQVLTNLLGNALTYTEPGGTVTIRVFVRDAMAVVAVQDSGIGLAPAELERVFERFYRVPGVSRPGGGSGIGLTIARGLARAHGGDVRARSAGPGTGSTFELTLPLAG